MHIYIYTYIHIYVYMYIYMYLYVYIDIDIDIDPDIDMDIDVNIHMHIHIDIHIHTCILTCIDTHMNTRINIYISSYLSVHHPSIHMRKSPNSLTGASRSRACSSVSKRAHILKEDSSMAHTLVSLQNPMSTLNMAVLSKWCVTHLHPGSTPRLGAQPSPASAGKWLAIRTPQPGRELLQSLRAPGPEQLGAKIWERH